MSVHSLFHIKYIIYCILYVYIYIYICVCCLNIHRAHVTANNSTNNNVVGEFYSPSQLGPLKSDAKILLLI